MSDEADLHVYAIKAINENYKEYNGRVTVQRGRIIGGNDRFQISGSFKYEPLPNFDTIVTITDKINGSKIEVNVKGEIINHANFKINASLPDKSIDFLCQEDPQSIRK
jgi:hypothetical protein